MKAGVSLLMIAVILALIKTKNNYCGIKMKIGPTDVDDILELLIEYLVYVVVTLMMGSQFWISCGIVYSLSTQKYVSLGCCLVLCWISKIKIVRELNLMTRILISCGLVNEVTPITELLQAFLGLGLLLFFIMDLRSIT